MNLVRFVFQLLHLYFGCGTRLDKNVVPTFIVNTHEFNYNFVSRRFLFDNKLSRRLYCHGFLYERCDREIAIL